MTHSNFFLSVGNCWFIAGTAVVSTIPKLLYRCVPTDQDFDKDYAGTLECIYKS